MSRIRKTIEPLVVVFLALLLTPPLRAQQPAVDFQELSKELYQTAQSTGYMTFVQWLPEEYWRTLLSRNPNPPLVARKAAAILAR